MIWRRLPRKRGKSERRPSPDEGWSFGKISTMAAGKQVQKQCLPKNLVAEALLNAPISWYGKAGAGASTDDQMIRYKYPEDGCSEVHMIWTDSPCWITCWNDSNSYVKALRQDKIEFVLAQHPWMETDCQLADIILPVSTKFEEEDIDNDRKRRSVLPCCLPEAVYRTNRRIKE